MKYILMFIFSFCILFFTMISCNNESETSDTSIEKKFNTIRIDGCQYIEREYGDGTNFSYSYTLTHKGNCDNHIK